MNSMTRSQPHSADELDGAATTALRLFREIYGPWKDGPMRPGPEWYDSHGISGSLGESGVGVEGMLDEFERWVLPGAIRIPSPRYIGLVNSAPLPAGPLADLLVSAMDNNAGAEGQGPSAWAAEREVLRILGEWCYGRGDVGGMLLPGGSFANLQGIALAREWAFPEWSEKGPASLPGMPTLYVSEASHFSAHRAGTVIGLGRAGIRSVPAYGRGEMDASELRRMIASDRAAGRLPFAVVATVGTTGTGAFDPVTEIAEIAEAEKLWLHVDACYGGAALLVPELRRRFRGVERAQSIAVDPHKWLYIPLTCSVLLTPSDEYATRAFDISTSYIPSADQVDPYRRGIPTSRRTSALTLWAVLRAYGAGRLREMVRNDIICMRALEDELVESGFEVMSGGELSVACARWVPTGMGEGDIDLLQHRIADAAVDGRELWFGTVEHAGRTWLRFNLLNPYASEDGMRSVGREIAVLAASVAGS